MFWTVVILTCLAGKEIFAAKMVYRNGHRPEFSRQQFSAVISENTDENSAVIQVEARDEDIGSSIVYSIASGNEDGAFEIDPKNGIIKTKAKLDYEKKPNYNLIINANDGFYKAKCFVDVKVVNVNDEKPQFKKVFQEVEIPEKSLTSDCIANVTAYDPDLPENATHPIVYSLQANEEVEKFFKIDALGCLSQRKAYVCEPHISKIGEKILTVFVQAKDNHGDSSAKANVAEIKVHVRC